MKILWSINTVPKEAADKSNGLIKSGHAISWVDAMSNALSKKNEIEMYIVAPGGKKVERITNITIDNITYILLPKDCEKRDYWGTLIKKIRPDVIHAYGTEKRHNVLLIKNYANQIPIIISLQGLVTEYVKYYYAGLSQREIIKNYTLHDLIHFSGIYAGKLSFIKQCKYEKYMLENVRYVEGRSDWDRAFSMKINSKLKYYYCPRMIRSSFFDYEWKYEQAEKHTIFVHQGNYPIKGFHFLIDAISILVKKYPDLKLYVSGTDFFSQDKTTSGYIKLIKRKIIQYRLNNNIVFTGFLGADELARYLSKMNVCIIPSAIENAPNALAEAMIVGTPCIASDVGGNADMLNYGECGLFYCYDEPEMLAERVKKYFDDPKFTIEMAKNGNVVARNRHDPRTLENTLINIYNQVIEDFNL